MLPAAGKAERRNLRGSARLSSKMSGRQPRLRMLRPRPQQQQQQGKSNSANASVAVEATSRRAESNLKEAERLADARKRDARPVDAKAPEYTKASAMANEVDDGGGGGGGGGDDDDDDSYDGELMIVEDEQQPDVDLKEADEVIDLEPDTQNSYECKNCKPAKTLPSIKAYLEHLRRDHKHKGKSAHSPVENRCPACSYVALNVKDLEDHQRVHHLKRRFFRCAKCSYATHIRARYTKHVKYHYMPMIKCDACDFRTPYKWNLDRHTRNHGSAGAFQCRACNFTADIRQSLTVHEANHHDPPVGQVSRKSNNPFERKPRNSPKRYNQVGASDFQEGMSKLRSSMASSVPETFMSDSSVILVEDKKSAIAGAECIALKCDEKGCQFITSWDSEMQRHLAECHKPVVSPKSKKPLPMLIPLGSPNSKLSSAVGSGPPTTLLKVPRVRVRPELAQIARDTELAKMYGNKEATSSKKDLNTAAGIFERKNASFFDKLKEKLTTATNNGIREIAVSSVNDLKCWCTFKASSMEELALHKQTHHTALSVSVGTTRCPKCRRRCKSSADLQVHIQSCNTRNDTTTDSSLEKIMSRSDVRMTPYRGEYAFPSQLDWDVSLRGLNSSGSSFKGGSTLTSGRRVFKCPHCPFWASTASRFHVHIVGHLNRKPFECSMCAYRSNWRWDITKHIKLKAAKDAVHITAKVLMTDETGRRNYSKYKKYLAQIEHLIWDEDRLEQRSVEETSSNEPPTKLLILNNKEHIPTAGQTSSPITILSSTDSSRNDHNLNLSLRPPPPLKSATKSRGQSLLKNNPITMNMQSVGGTCGGAVTISSTTATDESKRTQWKCKRCNYRDSNKDNVLLHVRSHYESNDQEPIDPERNPFGCGDCPFSAPDAATLSLHRVHHRPNLDAIFKCYRCPYYVSTKAELLEHARLHGEELATVHQQSMDHQYLSDSKKYKRKHALISDSDTSIKNEMPMEQMAQITARNKVTSVLKSPRITEGPPPLLLDTRILSESPLVWVTRPDGTLNKMFKCRHCPYVSLRRVEVQDHEVMHTSTEESTISCTDCTFTCSRKDIMITHTDMHNGCLGTVHCLVDETRPDNQQLNDLVNLLALKHPPVLGPEPDQRDSRLVHCCNKCPARFLCEKELRIHLRYHTTDLAYSCQWCSYAARQPSHLLAHQKAHSTEYQERTKYLLTMYGHSQRFPPPSTACVETDNSQESSNSGSNVAWIVVQLNENTSNSFNSSNSASISQRSSSQVFTCAKCPARYFKLDALEYHMTLHGSNNRFKCNDCDYSSKTAQNLVKHQVVHRRHNETNEAAPVSSPASVPTASPVSISPLNIEFPELQYSLYTRGNPNFVYPSYLRNGRMKEKRYKCHKCPSAFDKREQYRVHLTLHGAKQRYRCQTCDYSVQYYANYAQHRRKHLANAEAQASRRQFEDDRISLGSDTDIIECPTPRSSKSLRSSVTVHPITTSTAAANGATNAATNAAINATTNAVTNAATNATTNATTNNNVALQPSNQDKQSLLLLQKKGMIPTNEAVETRRCQNCPFSTTDKETMDAHKRRHGIERMTPSCPHCDYVPRKDENIGEHIKLHFTRLYKPESYVIVELLTLMMEKMPLNSRDAKHLRPKELLFKECGDGNFLPFPEEPLHSLKSSSSSMKTLKEKVIVDPNTGETEHLAV